MPRRKLKVALIHDWLTGLRGGERCLLEFIKIYPQADIYTLLHVPGATSPEIDRRVKQISFLQRIPGVRYFYRWLLPLYPLAVRSLRLNNYDLVISLSHAAAKNVQIPEGAKHICYCFTPMRYIWDQAESYFGRMRYFIWPIISWLRKWDLKGSERVDYFVCISRFVAARVKCFYKRKASVVYPPVADYWFDKSNQTEEEIFTDVPFLYAGALVPYKNVEKIVEAFNLSGQKLWIAGSGPLEEKLRRMSAANITFTGRISDARLLRFYKSCRALIFAAKEDFGLIPVESLAAGKPVIAPYAGALKESLANIRYWDGVSANLAPDQSTGVFFRYPVTVEEINNAVNFYIKQESFFSRAACRKQAAKFSEENFMAGWQRIEADVLKIGQTKEQVIVNA